MKTRKEDQLHMVMQLTQEMVKARYSTDAQFVAQLVTLIGNQLERQQYLDKEVVVDVSSKSKEDVAPLPKKISPAQKRAGLKRAFKKTKKGAFPVESYVPLEIVLLGPLSPEGIDYIQQAGWVRSFWDISREFKTRWSFELQLVSEVFYSQISFVRSPCSRRFREAYAKEIGIKITLI